MIKKLYEKYCSEGVNPDNKVNAPEVGSDEAKARRAGTPGRQRLNQLSIDMFELPFSKLNYAQKDKVMTEMDKQLSDMPLEEGFEEETNDTILQKNIKDFKVNKDLSGFLEIEGNKLKGEMLYTGDDMVDDQSLLGNLFDKIQKTLRKKDIILNITFPKILNKINLSDGRQKLFNYEVEAKYEEL